MVLSRFSSSDADYAFHDVAEAIGRDRYERLPYVARVLAENGLRNVGRPGCTREVLDALVDPAVPPAGVALSLWVPRIILPDSSGIPVLMDLAALRSAVARRGGDAGRVTTAVPIDFVVDHSLQVDAHGSPDAEAINRAREFARNSERYTFLKWAQAAFGDVRVFPPGSGIIHQVNLEQIAEVTRLDRSAAPPVAFPDFVIGGDSHTPMVNALGVLGWGVGGIEAEAVALGQGYVLPKPDYVGVRLVGRLAEGLTATDLALHITHRLRREGVVGSFVEFFGPAASLLAISERATLANMAPEYGATVGFWPVDTQTLAYLRLTGRSEQHVALVEDYTRAAGMFRNEDAPDPVYDRVVEIDFASVARAVAGPGKPHLLKATGDVAESFRARLAESGRTPPDTDIPEGAIAIAAITSCTNTANPQNMIRAGLLARAAAERGLVPKPWVKTSLAPGSRAVTAYLAEAGLLGPLEALGFNVVGYGCTTCGGKSGPLKPEMVRFVEAGGSVSAVLSGNRNFDGRIHRLVAANYLCSPALVVAFALAGRVTIDVDRDVLATDAGGHPVRLADLWPSDAEVAEVAARVLSPSLFVQAARDGSAETAEWSALRAQRSVLFGWDEASTYIVEPPFFDAPGPLFGIRSEISSARVLGIFEDHLNTDYVSPGGEIPPDSPAGTYLQSIGIAPTDFNSYVGRRGNHEVMARATYANLRIRNRMVEREGWWTRVWPEGEIVSFHEAAHRYRERGVPLIVLGGENFGSGSSRDWAAKGPALLGVGAVIARSFERIHRSNLIGVGIVPLLFREGQSVEAIGLDGSETYLLSGVAEAVRGGTPVQATARRADGIEVAFELTVDARSASETDLLQRGGMFQAALEMALRA